jgi:hypothetical protein
MKKLVAFLYTNTEFVEKEIRKTILFTTQTQTLTHKYLGINLTKEVKDLYNKNIEERS